MPAEAATAGLSLLVNGREERVEVGLTTTLLEVLRDRLGLTGAKAACGRGECGACTVLMDGREVLSCVLLARRVRGEVVTVEGLGPRAVQVREAFADHAAFQCGFCTPGHVVRACRLVEEGVPENEGDLRAALSGNICRCTGYAQIVDAIRTAAERML